MKISRLGRLGMLLALAACSAPEKPTYTPPANPLFVQLSPEETGLTFQNTVVDDSTFNVITYRNFYNGGGVAIGDVNNDGWPDVYLTSNSGKNRLYLNRKNWKFEDVTDRAGVGGTQAWSTGVTMADVNGDGWLDIYVCNSGNVRGDKKENELFINQRNGTFREQAAAYGLNDRGYSTHAAFFDYDEDGDLDCFVLNNSFKQIRKFDYRQDLRSRRDSLGGDKLYRNTAPPAPEGGATRSAARLLTRKAPPSGAGGGWPFHRRERRGGHFWFGNRIWAGRVGSGPQRRQPP